MKDQEVVVFDSVIIITCRRDREDEVPPHFIACSTGASQEQSRHLNCFHEGEEHHQSQYPDDSCAKILLHCCSH